MLDSLLGAFNAAKQLTPTLLLGTALAAGVLLLLPTSAIEILGLTQFRSENRALIGGTLVVTTSLLSAQLLARLGLALKRIYERRRQRRSQTRIDKLRAERLEKLTPDEKGYLLPYIANEENTLYFGIDDGVAGGLQAKEIIFRATNVGDMVTGFAFNLQPWAREHLSANPNLLEGARVRTPESRW